MKGRHDPMQERHLKSKLVPALAAMLLAALCSGAFAANSAPITELTPGGQYYFIASRVAAFLPANNGCTAMQGGGTDGTYAYYAMIGGGKTMIYKYRLDNWELAGVSEPMMLGHANDIAYDPVKGLLVLPACYSDLSTGWLYYVDPDTLISAGRESILLLATRVEYLPETGQMIMGTGYSVCLTSGEHYETLDRYFPCGGRQNTTQGIACDGRYVYDVRWDQQADRQVINVHDLEGNFIGDIPISGIQGEPENIFRLADGTFALGCNGSNRVYILKLKEKKN